MQKGFVQVIVLGIIVLAIVAAGAFYLGKQVSTPKPQSQTSTTQPTISQPSPSPTPDETANWKTYTRTQLRFSFKYPIDATLYENKSASVDGVVADSPDSVQLSLPVSCGYVLDNSLLTVKVSKSNNEASFGSPNVFSSEIKTQEIVFAGEKAMKAISIPGLWGSDQIGVQKDNLFYLVKGEPCFTQTADQILSTFKFTQ